MTSALLGPQQSRRLQDCAALLPSSRGCAGDASCASPGKQLLVAPAVTQVLKCWSQLLALGHQTHSGCEAHPGCLCGCGDLLLCHLKVSEHLDHSWGHDGEQEEPVA